MRTPLVSFALVAVMLSAARIPSNSSAADRPDDDDPLHSKSESPAKVRWYCQPPNGGPAIPPVTIMAGRHELTYLRIDRKQTPEVGTLDTAYSRDLTATNGATPHAALYFSYKLRVGESVPMLDAMYKVTDLRPRNVVQLIRTTDKDVVKNLTDNRNLLVIPVGSGIHFAFYANGQRLDDTSIVHLERATGGDTPSIPGRARISLKNATDAAERLSTSNFKDIDISVGDVVPLVLNCQLTVKKIVVPDENRKILGWVEFDPKPPATNENSDKK